MGTLRRNPKNSPGNSLHIWNNSAECPLANSLSPITENLYPNSEQCVSEQHPLRIAFPNPHNSGINLKGSTGIVRLQQGVRPDWCQAPWVGSLGVIKSSLPLTAWGHVASSRDQEGRKNKQKHFYFSRKTDSCRPFVCFISFKSQRTACFFPYFFSGAFLKHSNTIYNKHEQVLKTAKGYFLRKFGYWETQKFRRKILLTTLIYKIPRYQKFSE